MSVDARDIGRSTLGLTATEAMWKGAAVVGGNVGGIRRQIRDGENGFLVDTVDEAAERIVQIDPEGAETAASPRRQCRWRPSERTS